MVTAGCLEETGDNMKVKQTLNCFVRIVTLLFGIGLFSAATAYADKCSKRDSVELPSCAKEIRTGSTVKVVNGCPFTITVKWDIVALPDHKRDIAPGEEREIGSFIMKIRSVSCCPRYNKCSLK